MCVKSDGIAWDQPDELPRGEENSAADPDRLAEQKQATECRLPVGRLLVLVEGRLSPLEIQLTDEVPNGGAKCEADGCDNECLVVAELRDNDQCCDKGTCCTCDFVEDVDLKRFQLLCPNRDGRRG